MKKKHVGLTREEEQELIKKAQGGDGKAKAILLDTHTPFIATVLKEFTLPTWVPHEDVMQEGRFGMLDAIERFDLSSGNKLCTFAYWRIRKAIVAYLSEMGYPMKVPFPDVVKLKKIVNKMEAGGSENVEEDLKTISLPKNLHILSLIMGCIPISPTEYGAGRDRDDEPSIPPTESQLMTPDSADGVIGGIVESEIIDKLREMTVYEGFMLAQYLGFYVTEDPVPLKYIAGEKTKLVAGVSDHAEGGWNGFGLQIGETYNSCSKVIKQSEVRFKTVLRNFFDGLYAEYLESDHR